MSGTLISRRAKELAEYVRYNEVSFGITRLYITAMIYHNFVSFSTVQIYDISYIHLHPSPSTGILRTHKITSSQIGKALHRYRIGHGFESRILFQALISQLHKLCV